MVCLEGDYLLVFYDLRVPEFSPGKRGGLIRWMVSLEGDNLVVHLYFAISGHLNSLLDKRGGLIRWMVSLEGDYLLVFYDLRAPEFCLDKRGGFINGVLL